ncbi:hypothetical protein NTG1052_980004 [Candidatus Nitrotoga sp. 1052]|nr:hypothetical protein NTG1052_980004 [Candidatus Nitrotoga sp. 1052]
MPKGRWKILLQEAQNPALELFQDGIAQRVILPQQLMGQALARQVAGRVGATLQASVGGLTRDFLCCLTTTILLPVAIP